MDESTAPDDKNVSKEASQRSGLGVAGPGGVGEPDAATTLANFSSPFQEAIFIFVIGLSQLFSVGGIGMAGFSVQQIGRALNATSNGQMSWFLAS